MKYKINKNWKFYNLAISNDMLTEEFDDNYWQDVNLPHDWAIDNNFDQKNYKPTVLHEKHLEARDDSFLPRGEGIYRKKLTLPKEAKNSQVFLEFDGVFGESFLYIDGIKVGENLSGYTGKLYDITSFVENKEVVNLALRVNANRMQGWWYEGAGIYRHVHLIILPKCYINEWGVGITTKEITPKNATIDVAVEITNAIDDEIPCQLEIKITNPDGAEVANTVSCFTASKLEEKERIFTLPVPNPQLWDVDSPKLYQAKLTLKANDSIQCKDVTFGIRSFYFTPDDGFYLNGRKLQLRGGNLHHDFGGLGVALPDRAHEKNVEVIKELGANIIRSAHNPAAPALMDACDRLGLLFWAETRNLYPEFCAKEDLTSLIKRDRNHPSIICWSLANTAGSLNGSLALTNRLQILHNLAKRLDPTRPTAVGLEGNADFNLNKFACVTDVVGYNGGGMAKDVIDHQTYPDRCIAISEYSSGRGARGIYEKEFLGGGFKEVLGDGRVVTRDGKKSTEQELLASHAKEWSHIAANSFLAGGLMWSIIEYRGETSGFPIVTSQFGIFDICRFPKDAYYYYKMMWQDSPLVHIYPPWNFKVKDNTPVEVYCLSNCQKIELYLNNEKILEEDVNFNPTNSTPYLKWSIPYKKGHLQFRGINNGQVVVTEDYFTCTEAKKIKLTSDRSILEADEEDIAFIRIDILDKDDHFVNDAQCPITLSVKGEGTLLGVCSGNPASHESEKSNTVTTFSGSALAIVQTTNKNGNIEVEVTSLSLDSAIITLESC